MGAGRRPAATTVVGMLAIIAGSASAWVVLTDGDGSLGWPSGPDAVSIYGPEQAMAAAGLVVSGAGLVLLRARGVAATCLVLAALCAALLAGAGLVGVRKWPHYWGCCAPGPVEERALVQSLALGMGAGCAVLAVALATALMSGGHVRWRGWESAPGLVAAVVVAVTVPPTSAAGRFDASDLAAVSLVLALPVAAALGAAALLERRAALAILAFVAVAEGVAASPVGGSSFLAVNLATGEATPVVAAAVVVSGAARAVPAWRSRGLTPVRVG